MTRELISPLKILTSTIGPGVLHIVQHRGSNAGQLAQALVVKISHGDPLELVSDGNALVCHHEITGVGLLELGEPVYNGPAMMLTSSSPRACHAGAGEVEPSTKASTIT